MFTNMNEIPAYVSSWTDKYFHHSAFDISLMYPNKKTIGFLTQFKKKRAVKLYRGLNKYNKEKEVISSWTYNKEVAKNYAGEEGIVVRQNFKPENIILDTTTLNCTQKKMLGYDYKVDDKEVIIFH